MTNPLPHPLQRIEGLLLDLDGTLYVSGALLPRTLEFIETLSARKLPFLCLTNNSSASGADYVTKLRRLGIEVREDQVLTSGQATLHYLLEQTSYRSAYVVGTPALREEFSKGGMCLEEDNPDCLVVGYDTTLDYEKLCVATRLCFANKPYYATHPDLTCITDRGLLPDIAATIASLEAVTGRLPQILGKPERAMVDAAARRLGLAAENLAMVGDQLDTDITMACRHGLLGVLVLSGETSGDRLLASDVEPDLVVTDVGELADKLMALAPR
ncbi:MAG: HAD-IIA family hydrolase [Deltaproteobacteria bacterium]|nr:HAD-IIA family hydrolase [Deltaproteobacteria bacterium]